MTTNQTRNHDDASIDALARRAGADVRQPAPDGLVTGIHRARRRQQATRAALGTGGALAVVAALVLVNRPDRTTRVIEPGDPTPSISIESPVTTVAGRPPDSTGATGPVNGPPSSAEGAAPPAASITSGMRSVDFADAQNGWMLGTGGTDRLTLTRTTDGGLSWQPASTTPIPAAITSVTFATERDGYLFSTAPVATSAADAGLYVTHDAGATWQRSAAPLTTRAIVTGPDTDILVAPTCDKLDTTDCALAVLSSTNHGDTWTFEANEALPAATHVSTLRSNDLLFVAGTDDNGKVTLSRSPDGGATWATLASPCGEASETFMDADNSGTVWMACGGERGSGQQLKLIARSFDNGDSWTVTADSGLGSNQVGSIGTSGYLAGLGVSAGDFAFVALDRGTLMSTLDGGVTWNSVPGLPTEAFFADFFFLDIDHAFAAIASGQPEGGIFRSSDGGLNWLRLNDVPAPAIPDGGVDPDGVPDGIYVYADEAYTTQHVLDPNTLEILETRPAAIVSSEPRDSASSASGAVTYALEVYGDVERDACRQTHNRVNGGRAAGLPEWMTDLAISADGRVGAVASAECTAGQTLDEYGRPSQPLDIEVSLFDADQPDLPARTVATVNGVDEQLGSISLSADGSLLMISTSPYLTGEGYPGVDIRIIDTATGNVIVDHGPDTAFDMPHGECSTFPAEPRFVGTSAVTYASLCPDAIYVVIRDLVTGETIDVAATEYVGRTYETMVSAGLTVDEATYVSPKQSWFILCADRETTVGGVTNFGGASSNSCWLGNGDQPLRPIPSPTALTPSFKPLV